VRRLHERLRGWFAPAGVSRMIQMGDLLTASWVSQGIHAIASLGVADHMSASPSAVADTARSAGVDEDSLYRVLRMLVPAGLFEEHADRRFCLTALGALLRSDHPNSMRGFATYNGTPWHWGMWGELARSVKSGAPAHADGERTLFDFLATDEDAASIFDAAMADLSNARDVSAISGYDFARFKTVADIGGGEGRLIRSVLTAFPSISGVLFDRPSVIERARARVVADGLTTRCALVGGSFFESVPPGADAYMLKQVLHDWQDDKAALILRNCRRAMGENSVLLAIEMVVPGDAGPSLAKLSDIEMLVCTGGRERTLAEYDALFAGAGLHRVAAHETRSPFALIEARPI